MIIIILSSAIADIGNWHKFALKIMNDSLHMPEKTQLNKVRNYFFRDFRKPFLHHKKSGEAFLVRIVRIFLITIKSFMENRVVIRASALTYYSLLSLVPVVAMLFGIAKGFGFDKRLQAELVFRFNGQKEVLNWIITFANSMLRKSQGGVVASAGLLLLFWTIMRVLHNIELSFNDIWQIKKARPWNRKFSDYLSIIIIAPVFVLLSSSLTVYVSTKLSGILTALGIAILFKSIVIFLIGFIPYVLLWVLFTLMYMVMPNTKVKLSSALTAGILAGSIFQVVQWSYFKFQIGMSNYNAVYGSFAALPLFMIWMQTSWLIVLFGAELSFAAQNEENYAHENNAMLISPALKRLLSLQIIQLVIKNFAKGQKALSVSEISHQLDLPVRIATELLYLMQQANLVIEVVSDDPKESVFQPAVYINLLSVQYVINKLDNVGKNDLYINNLSDQDSLKKILEEFNKILDASPENILIKDIPENLKINNI